MPDVEAQLPKPQQEAPKDEFSGDKQQLREISLASIASRLHGHFSTDVSTNHADILMLSCCFISGLVDSTVYDGNPIAV